MSAPQSSAEYARARREEQQAKRPSAPRVKLPTLADFPALAVAMAEKQTAWVENPDLRRVVMLALCIYWTSLSEPQRIAPPGGEEYEAYRLLLKLALAPVVLPCVACGWPRAVGYHCHSCGDPAERGGDNRSPIGGE